MKINELWRSSWPARWAALALFASATVAAQTPQQEVEPGEFTETESSSAPSLTELFDRLENVESSKEDVIELSDEMATCGPDACAELFELIRNRRPTQADGDLASDVLSRVLTTWGRDSVLERLPTAAETFELPDRRARLFVYGAVGTTKDLPHLISLAVIPRTVEAPEAGITPSADDSKMEAESQELDPSVLHVDLEQALGRIVVRDRSALDVLLDLGWESGPDIMQVLIRTVGGHPSIASLRLLGDVLVQEPRIETITLSALGRCAEAQHLAAPEEVRRCVRVFLWEEDEQVLREAILAVGKLADEDAVERLIELLDSESEVVSEASHWALRRITGLDFPGGAKRWQAWYRAEIEWLQDELPRLSSLLEDQSPERAAETIRELARRKLHRAPIATEIEKCFNSESSELRREACEALGRLGAKESLEVLIEQLDDENDVAEAARAALCKITGLDVPADGEAWHAACTMNE